MTHDMYTPYPGAVRVAHELGDARLLTVDGYGHPSGNSTCAWTARDAYLLSGAVPAAGARCAQDAGPSGLAIAQPSAV